MSTSESPKDEKRDESSVHRTIEDKQRPRHLADTSEETSPEMESTSSVDVPSIPTSIAPRVRSRPRRERRRRVRAPREPLGFTERLLERYYHILDSVLGFLSSIPDRWEPPEIEHVVINAITLPDSQKYIKN